MRKRTYDLPVELRREWFLVELAYLTKKYGIEIAVRKNGEAPFLKDQITERKIGADLQYDKYDDEYIVEL
ncbi:hypothetical protein D0U04_17895 [Bacillus clarus]|uniref:Uncharacterized protein n=1 Tax=Bacillus clarus TaxID=2338372 RepID=A0A090YXC1_9BACI|nr:hypothetical protein [Bacillus clarus]KFN02768.1 hypothetical protein DJ93_4585 [Bacillus clarus]RFT65632.1 hypothetical protein D0U04_17895 [Bacillus clarus]